MKTPYKGIFATYCSEVTTTKLTTLKNIVLLCSRKVRNLITELSITFTHKFYTT